MSTESTASVPDVRLDDYPAAAALSFVLMAIILVGVAAYSRALGTERLTG